MLAKDLADESTQARNQVVESIRMFNGQSTSPYTLPGDQIERLYYMTSGVMTVGAEHFSAWKDALEKLRQDVVERISLAGHSSVYRCVACGPTGEAD